MNDKSLASSKLRKVFWAYLAIAMMLLVLCETDLLDISILAGYERMEYISAVVMELIMLITIPRALFVVRMSVLRKWITSDSVRINTRYDLFANLRMLVLALPMILNLVFYYAFGNNPTFGYMAVIYFICMFLVYPSEARYESETNKQ